jgi:hypothetical protein
VPARALRSFAGLSNSNGLAVVDARLCLRELFDALSRVCPGYDEKAGTGKVLKAASKPQAKCFGELAVQGRAQDSPEAACYEPLCASHVHDRLRGLADAQ